MGAIFSFQPVEGPEGINTVHILAHPSEDIEPFSYLGKKHTRHRNLIRCLYLSSEIDI